MSIKSVLEELVGILIIHKQVEGVVGYRMGLNEA